MVQQLSPLILNKMQ